MAAHTRTWHTHVCVHAHIVTFMVYNPRSGLLYKVYNATDITVPHYVQSFTHSRGTGANGPAQEHRQEWGQRDKNKDAKALKADTL